MCCCANTGPGAAAEQAYGGDEWRKIRVVDRDSSGHLDLLANSRPATVIFNKNGIPDLLVGAADGHLGLMSR